MKQQISELWFGKASKDDLPAIKQLWWQCFPEDREGPFIQWYFRHHFLPERTWLCKTKTGELLSMLIAPDLHLYFRGRQLLIPYIQGVATSIPARGQGLANRLLGQALAELAAEQIPFALLKPFRVDFYARTGWTIFNRLYETAPKIATGPALNQYQVSGLQGYRMHIAALERIYRRWLQQNGSGCWVERSLENWQSLLADHRHDGGKMLLATKSGEPVAYALYSRQQAVLIRELAYTEALAAEAVLAALKKRSGKSALILRQPEGIPLQPETVEGGRLYPFGMGRILNLRAAFEVLGSSLPADLCLDISDELLPDNQGIWQFDSGAKIKKIAPANHQKPLEGKKIIKLDISQLTKLYLGCYNFNDSLLVEEDPRAALSKFLPPVKTYFAEYFV